MKRVLIVDDHPDVAHAVSELVRVTGCEATVFYNGREALDFLRANGADLVVLDVSMPPGMSGLAVLREMEAESMLPGTPVIMFSASEEFREKSLRLGAAGFVLKHEADRLIERIEQFLHCNRVPPDSRGSADILGQPAT
jgi:CheY-like chemotaxis protein